ncbi:CRISPR-associated protein Cas4 [Picrophilus oshimae]|uniref:CRISPR-associated exonuclease Cas4 n=1 Tax=Picrophilus torridus (strain ATCC 700027 / DSM 9790 / JCM 10055 / NBRC 100828 / KAW 2/3) TaxID=1122961 RepID=A0A8G2L7R9_PICTO|nr:CRISPR-associated protein Cas4 [Picrophilus oshimae]SMD31393.1 CRISPR-associated exonuclease, Cas4 family [Picrophilus oshimae DSM 9789]
MNDLNITGTMIWYYNICKREVWLISHGIEADQDDDNIIIGRTIHEHSYNRDRKEINIENSRIDAVENKDGKTIIVEIKKSSKTENAAKMQLLYYMYQLYKPGTNITGELRFPAEKKIIRVELTEENIEKLVKIIEDIKRIIEMEIPKPVKNIHCRNCAYSEFCWS